jgi:sulfate transport system ATP-binding protein
VKDGRAALGSLAFHAPPGTGNGASVRAFVRPHDVELTSPPSTPPAESEAVIGESPQPSVATALIERMARIGWMVKMELRMADGQALSVEITKDRVAELGLAEGDRVLVNLKDAKVFVQDYAI